MPQPAVFFDRDGVLVKSLVRDGKPYAARTLDEFCPLENAPKVIAEIKAKGYLAILVTNQPDVGNGFIAQPLVEEMNDRLQNLAGLNGVYSCFHSQKENCSCRKPKPGMLLLAAREQNIDLSRSFMVGDRKSDIDAGAAAGVKTIWIETHYSEPAPTLQDFTAKTLDAVAALVPKIKN